MNQSVLEKARELAAAIAASPEYITMRAAEDAATQDEALAEVYGRYAEKHQAIEELSASENPDFEVMGTLSRELDEIQEEIKSVPLARAMQDARKGFTDMMAMVNGELQRVLAPEEEGCGGDCGSCGGCGHHH